MASKGKMLFLRAALVDMLYPNGMIRILQRNPRAAIGDRVVPWFGAGACFDPVGHANAFIYNGGVICAVSYTHLDVYKRQGKRCYLKRKYCHFVPEKGTEKQTEQGLTGMKKKMPFLCMPEEILLFLPAVCFLSKLG